MQKLLQFQIFSFKTILNPLWRVHGQFVPNQPSGKAQIENVR